jgi:hypothetical protein
MIFVTTACDARHARGLDWREANSSGLRLSGRPDARKALWGRHSRGIPTASQGLNKLHRRDDLLHSKRHGGLLVDEQSRLRGSNVQVGIEPGLVTAIVSSSRASKILGSKCRTSPVR